MMTTALLGLVALSLAQVSNPYQGETRERPRWIAEHVLASELDPALPAIPIGDWIKSTVQTVREVGWIQTGCPATTERVDGPQEKRAVCMLAIASQLEIVGFRREQIEPIVSISIRLGTGNPNLGVWQLERPRVEDAFIEREGDSLSVPRLRELPQLLRLPLSQWPKSELSVAPEDIRCDNTAPRPGDRVRCQATVHNRGPVEAIVRFTASLLASHTDLSGTVQSFQPTIRPNDQAILTWDWVGPEGNTWSLSVRVEVHTPRAFGGYRVPMKERNVGDNSAYVIFPRPK
jgi:hypothetical protein